MDKKKTAILALAAVLLLAAAGAAAWFFLLRDGGEDGPPAGSGTTQAEGMAAGDPAGGPAGADLAGADLAGQDPAGGQDADGVDGITQTGMNPDIQKDTSVLGNGDAGEAGAVDWGRLDSDPEEDGTDVGPEGGDGPEDGGDAEDDADEPSGPVAPERPEDDEGDGRQEEGTGVSAPEVADPGPRPETEPETEPDDADGPADGGQEMAAAMGEAPGEEVADAVPCTFLKAVYSRDKKKVLVSVALPSGKTVSDPSGYAIAVKTDDNGHAASKGVIYACPERSELVIYLNSAYFFGPGASFALVPIDKTGSVQVTKDCFVELPYGDRYTASKILDGSRAEFRDMMRLMFADTAVVDTWTGNYKSNVRQSLLDLTGSLDGQSTRQLDAVQGTAAGSGGQDPQPVETTVQGQSGTGTEQPSGSTEGDLGPAGGGTSAAG